MFSSQNFLMPVNTGDKVIKIRNVNGQLAFIVRDPTCTIRQEGVWIYIKQQSESQTISLDFVSADDASTAHLLLREAFIAFGNPISLAQGEYSFNPASNSTQGVNFNMTLPVHIAVVTALYVNGVFVPNQFYLASVSGSNTILTWKSNAEYILETTDLVTIKYN